MATRKSKNRALMPTLLLLGLTGGAIVGAYVLSTPDAQRVPDPIRRQRPGREAAKPKERPRVLVARFERDGKLKLQGRDTDVPRGQDARLHVVNEFLRDNEAVVPGAKAIGIDVRDGIAFVTFNQAMDRTFGTDDERLLVNGLLATLGQFPEIQRAQFEVAGKPVETFGGIDLGEPQPVIRDGDTEAASVNP